MAFAPSQRNQENSNLIDNATTNTGFILKVSIVAALGGLLFGFDTAIISGSIPFITEYFNLSPTSLGWAVGSILIGCTIGALIAGSLAETYGRKFVLIFCALLFAVSGIGVALSNNLFLFNFFRIIGGFGVGAAAIVSPMYIAEIAPANWRGRLVSMYQLAIVSGILLAYFSNYILTSTGENNWRWMFFSQTAPSILFLIMLFIVPETPRWLIKKGRTDEAKKILEKSVGSAEAETEFQKISLSCNENKQSSFANLFLKKYRNVLLIGIFIAVFQQVTGINAILYYAPVIFKETGLNTDDSLLQTIVIGVVNLLSTFIAIGLVDKVGRKKFLLIGSLLMGLSLVTVSICFYFQYFKNYVVLISLLTYVASFGCTLGAVTWVYLSEIFPNSIRGLAMSAATFALWVADFIVTYTFPLINASYGTSVTLIIYAVLCVIAFVYIYIKVPETKGKTLEELEKIFVE
jgi:MFS transporter, SP family, arabinose:H+ symporter